ncbi:hypothetical protein ERJ75_000719000 [Trypanosoma vivax]|nr:hypothetical protein ERJ75_000719000 [Trypanosoma vivax]
MPEKDSAVAPLKQRQWCVNVAVQSFSGELWALEKSAASSMDSGPGDDPVVSHAPEDSVTTETLYPCEKGIKKAVGRAITSEEVSHYLNILNECNSDEKLVGRITHLEFALSTPSSACDNAEDSSTIMDSNSIPPTYKFENSPVSLFEAVLAPPISAVVDECLDATVVVYGPTHEMKQLGVEGTPDQHGLLPRSIYMLLGGCARQGEQNAAVDSVPAPSSSDPVPPNVDNGAKEDEGTHCEKKDHHFVRAEACFIAFDGHKIVDLLDLSNDRVAFDLQLGDAAEGFTANERECPADTRISGARAVSVENAEDALNALDVGLDNYERITQTRLPQFGTSASLLFSITLFTDDCHSAVFRVFCLGEDSQLHDWLVSSTLTMSRALWSADGACGGVTGKTTSGERMSRYVLPSPLRHHAATLLAPLLCVGKVYVSLLVCVYNYAASLRRLTRDLSFALAGTKMITRPCKASVQSRCSRRPLPPKWEEKFTNDGRSYFIEWSVKKITWEDPRLAKATEGRLNECHSASRGLMERHMPQFPGTSMPLSVEERLFLDVKSPNMSQNEESSQHEKDTVTDVTSDGEPCYSIVLATASGERHVLLGCSPPLTATGDGSDASPTGPGCVSELSYCCGDTEATGKEHECHVGTKEHDEAPGTPLSLVDEVTSSGDELPESVPVLKSDSRICEGAVPSNACQRSCTLVPDLSDMKPVHGERANEGEEDGDEKEVLNALLNELKHFFKLFNEKEERVRFLEEEVSRMRLLSLNTEDVRASPQREGVTRLLREQPDCAIATSEDNAVCEAIGGSSTP